MPRCIQLISERSLIAYLRAFCGFSMEQITFFLGAALWYMHISIANKPVTAMCVAITGKKMDIVKHNCRKFQNKQSTEITEKRKALKKMLKIYRLI